MGVQVADVEGGGFPEFTLKLGCLFATAFVLIAVVAATVAIVESAALVLYRCLLALRLESLYDSIPCSRRMN